MRAFREQGNGMQELGDLGLWIAVAKHGQPEGRFGNEYIARHALERRAGRIGDVFVVAGGHDSQAVGDDLDLCRAEHVSGWMESHRRAIELDGLAIAYGLRRSGEIFAIAQSHEIERFPGGEHGAMAGAGVVGVAVGNHGFVHRLRWIDMEPAEPAAQAGGRRQQNVLGAHLP